jgi:hypothetical protein
MNVTYELSLLQLTVANQAKELEKLQQQIDNFATPKEHDYSKCWKTKYGTLLAYNEMSNFHLFCAIQRVWSTSQALPPLLREAQARWKYIQIDKEDNNKLEFFRGESTVADLLSEEHIIGSSLRRKATVLAYRSLKAAGVDVALTI